MFGVNSLFNKFRTFVDKNLHFSEEGPGAHGSYVCTEKVDDKWISSNKSVIVTPSNKVNIDNRSFLSWAELGREIIFSWHSNLSTAVLVIFLQSKYNKLEITRGFGKQFIMTYALIMTYAFIQLNLLMNSKNTL